MCMCIGSKAECVFGMLRGGGERNERDDDGWHFGTNVHLYDLHSLVPGGRDLGMRLRPH